MTLPKLEAGYHYQGILGQTFQGIHAGVTIPLWENKNTVKMQRAKLVLADLNLQDHRNEHYYEIKQLYIEMDFYSQAYSHFLETEKEFL